MLEALAIKLNHCHIWMPTKVIVQKKIFFEGARVVPGFPVDGHTYF